MENQELKANVQLEGLLEDFHTATLYDSTPKRNTLFVWLTVVIPILVLTVSFFGLCAKSCAKKKRKVVGDNLSIKGEFKTFVRTHSSFEKTNRIANNITKVTIFTIVMLDLVVCCFWFGVSNVTLWYDDNYHLNEFHNENDFIFKDEESGIEIKNSISLRRKSCQDELYSLKKYNDLSFFQNNSYSSIKNLNRKDKIGVIVNTRFYTSEVKPIGLLLDYSDDDIGGVRLCYLCYEKPKQFGVSVDSTGLLAVFLLFDALVQPYIKTVYITTFTWVCFLITAIIFYQNHLLSQWDIYGVLSPRTTLPSLSKCVISYKYLENLQPVFIFFLVYLSIKGSFLVTMMMFIKCLSVRSKLL